MSNLLCGRWIVVSGCVVALCSSVRAHDDNTSPKMYSVERANLDWQGLEANLHSQWPRLSSNGRFVVFTSLAPLVPADTNVNVNDVYFRDSATGALELISVNLAGMSSPLKSFLAVDVSDDGRSVAFVSEADDLVGGPVLSQPKAFVRDRVSGQTILVSVRWNGQPGNGWTVCLSGDGRFAAFSSSTPLVAGELNGTIMDVYVRDLATSTTELVSWSYTGGFANDGSGGIDSLDVSFDGRWVVFTSGAKNLVPGDIDTKADVFLRDRTSGTTQLVSVGAGGAQVDGDSLTPRCSSDGRFVVFESDGTTLVPGDTNASWDIFLRDMVAGTTERVSVGSAGVEADRSSHYADISPDGRYISYHSLATNLVANDNNLAADIFLFDRVTKTTTRVSTSATGMESDRASYVSSLSAGAAHIAFDSIATNLVASDSNGVLDIFVRRCAEISSYCTAKTNSLGCVPAIAASGSPAASWPQGFPISATNLINQTSGMLLYSIASAKAAPFQGGFLCVRGPARRTPAQSTGGSPTGLDCTGSITFDFDAWIASGVDPTLVEGRRVWAQVWSRDPGFTSPNNTSLTDALTFELLP